jgi:hypothetical protein
MRKIIAHEWMSLDGVVQAPSYAGEDPAVPQRQPGHRDRCHLGYLHAHTVSRIPRISV